MNIFEIVKDHIPFEVVSRHYGIEFHGDKALCPFRNEKTPSFHNYATHAYCFGCSKVADAIDLEAHFTKLSPFEAALSLAKRCGVQLLEFTARDKEKADRQVLTSSAY
jgi:DNA primase